MRVFADLGTLVTYFLIHSLFALTAGKISTGMGRAKGKRGTEQTIVPAALSSTDAKQQPSKLSAPCEERRLSIL